MTVQDRRDAPIERHRMERALRGRCAPPITQCAGPLRVARPMTSVGRAWSIDDQLAYCRSAMDVGLGAIQVSRADRGESDVPGLTRVRSFDEIEP